MIPGVYNLTIYQGDTFELTFRLRDSVTRAYLDLTDCTVSSQIRLKESTATPLAVIAGALQDQTATTGGITLSLTPTETAALAPVAGNTAYVWDVQLTWPGGRVETYLKGSVTVIAQVTR